MRSTSNSMGARGCVVGAAAQPLRRAADRSSIPNVRADWTRGAPGRRFGRAMADKVYVDNDEAIEAWNTVLFDRFVQYRHLVVAACRSSATRRCALQPPPPAARRRIGCGFGDTPSSSRRSRARGQRARPRRRRALHRGGARRTRGRRRQRRVPGRRRQADDSRAVRLRLRAHGDDVLRQPRRGDAQRPRGARAGRRAEHGRLALASSTTSGCTARSRSPSASWPSPEEYDELTCGPGPFSMANADTTSEHPRRIAGFEQIALRRLDIEC